MIIRDCKHIDNFKFHVRVLLRFEYSMQVSFVLLNTESCNVTKIYPNFSKSAVKIISWYNFDSYEWTNLASMSSCVWPTGKRVRKICWTILKAINTSQTASRYLFAFSDPPSICQKIFSGKWPFTLRQACNWDKKTYMASCESLLILWNVLKIDFKSIFH